MPAGMIAPTWFFGMDVIFQLVFTLITLAVTVLAFKIHKLTGENQPKLLGYAFLFFAIGYFIQSFFNFAILSRLGDEICTLAKIQSIHTFELFGTYFYMIFSLIGIVTLTYMTLKTTDKRIYFIILTISLVGLFLSINPAYFFYATTSILFGFIVYFYAKHYGKHKHPMTFIVLLAFIFLLFSHVHYILAVNRAMFYVLAHYLDLVAYILILFNLILVHKK